MLSDALAFSAPKLREDILIGSGTIYGARTVYHLKDDATGRMFRVGPKEHFIISRLNGNTTLGEIATHYTATFNRALTDDAFASIFTMLATRQLLEGTFDERNRERFRAATERQRVAQRGRRYFPFLNPTPLVARLDRYFGFIFNQRLTLLLLTMIAVALVGLWPARSELIAAWRVSVVDWPIIAAVMLFYWCVTAIHELAHALTCYHYGGRPNEIGIMWHYLFLVPYTKVDDVVFFPERGPKVYTALAGVYVNFLFVLPAALLWWLAPADSATATFAALTLLVLIGTTLLNLLPFLDLDGYFALSHSLGLLELRQHAFQYWLQRLRGGASAVAPYPRHIARIYQLYGAASLIVTILFFVGIVFAGIAGLQRLWTFLAGVVMVTP